MERTGIADDPVCLTGLFLLARSVGDDAAVALLSPFMAEAATDSAQSSSVMLGIALADEACLSIIRPLGIVQGINVAVAVLAHHANSNLGTHLFPILKQQDAEDELIRTVCMGLSCSDGSLEAMILLASLELIIARVNSTDGKTGNITMISKAGSGISAILNLGDNRENFRRLREQMSGSLGVVPFVGAGLSVPCGMPGWKQFLVTESKSIDKKQEVAAILGRDEYEEAAQLIANELGIRAFADRLDSVFGEQRLSTGTLRGAVLRLPSMFRGPVLTTNFDHVLERVYLGANAQFEQVVWGARQDMFARALHENSRYLLKVHGDVLDRGDRILTLVDYEHHYGGRRVSEVDFQKPIPRILEQIFTSRTLLFLGCSLGPDRTVQLIRRVAEQHAASPSHYAIVERPKVSSKAVDRAKFLANHNIRPIWFSQGDYGSVDDLLAELQMP